MGGKRKYCYDHPRPMVTVDCALFRLSGEDIELLLIRRGRAPHKGAWALPGGFIKMKEPLEDAVAREVAEETGIGDIPFLVQVGAYGDPKRDPRGRVITVSYAGIVSGKGADAAAGSDATDAMWFPIERMPAKLAFDHPTVIGDALRKIATLGRTSGALFVFVDDKFTADELKVLLRALYGIALNPKQYLDTFIEMGLVRPVKGRDQFRFVGAGVGRKRRKRGK